MNALLRAGACAVVLLGAVLFVGYVLVPWLGGPSLFPTDLADVCQRLLTETSRRDELHERSCRVLEQLEGKEAVTQDVVGGRTSLLEAVAEFRRLRDLEEERLESAGLTYRTEDPGDEALARNVIAWARVAVRGDPR